MNKLPDGWQEKYIDEVFEIRKNYSNARKDLDNNSDISYLHYGDIHKYYQHHLDCQKIFLPKISKNKLSKNINKLELVKNGDLIIVDVSEDYEGICASVEVKNLSYKLVSGLHTVLLRDKGNYFADGYKGYIFYNHNVHKECCKVATGISVYGINRENLKKIKIPIPPLEEQKRIASALSKIDAYLENTIKLIEEKEIFKNGIAKKLLNKEARFEGFNDEWEIVRLGDMFDSFTERNNEDKIILASTRDKGVIPHSLTERKVIRKKESLSNYKLVKKGCFVISLMSFQGGFEYSDYEGIISPAYTVLKPKIEMAHYFYKYYFKSYKFIKDLRPYAEGIRHGKQIKFNACKDILVPYPSIKEQKAIGEYLSLLDTEIDNLKEQKEEIKKIKKGVMKKLMRGEIRL